MRADIGGAPPWGAFGAVQRGRPKYRVGERRQDGASVERGDGKVRADIGGAQRWGVFGVAQPGVLERENY